MNTISQAGSQFLAAHLGTLAISLGAAAFIALLIVSGIAGRLVLWLEEAVH